MNGVYTHELLLVYSRINTNTSPLVSCLSNQSLYSQKVVILDNTLWSILSSKKIHQAATLNQRAVSNCRFFNFTLFSCYCCSFWVLRLPVDVSISPLLAMSYWNRSQWNSWDNQWQQPQSPPPPSSNPPVSLPSHWRSTSQCWDDQVQYGYRLYRSIQPTAWSRKRNLAGQDPLSVPLSHLTRHGPDEAALRALSEGRFVGIICAKSVAESVFGSQILKTLRDQGIDIDATAESLHRQLAPQQGIPNRTDKPIEFMAPLVQFIADKLKAQCPVKQDTAAMRKLQETEAKLQAAKTKLAQAGILDTPQRSRRTTGTFAPDPKLPTDDDDGPGSAGSVISDSPAVVSTSLRKRSSEALGASPKALPKQRKLVPNKAAASPKDVTSATQSPTQLTSQEILEPKAPNLRENQLSGTTAANVKKWTHNFNLEAQQMSKKIMEIIKAAKCTKEQLQQVSTQYGLNLSDVLKLSITSLQQAVAVGAAVTAWLAMDVSKHRPKAVLDYITVLRSVFIKIVHFVPAVNKSCAIWALGLLHLICLFHFGSRTYHTQVWQRRLQNLGINPESYTFVFFQCTAVTYLKMQFNLPNSTSLSYKQAGRFYIGSTSIGMAKREFNRMAKYRLAKDGTPVHVELAVKYWSRRSDFSNFAAIPIASFSTYQEAWIFEPLLISRWQPPLNHPFITKILTLKASGWLVQYKKHSQTFPSIPEGNRLFQRLRRRLTTKGVPPSIHCKQAQA